MDRTNMLKARDVRADVVTVNSSVLFEDETTGECRNVTIVFPRQADAARECVSVLAPVAMALLGLAKGQSIAWPFPDGSTRRLRVLKIVRRRLAVTKRAG
jgi:regulator of nucleoside diphosphate kinase